MGAIVTTVLLNLAILLSGNGDAKDKTVETTKSSTTTTSSQSSTISTFGGSTTWADND